MGELHARDITEYLEEQRQKETLRFITCGSVDDGKSTLIGRLLFESKCIFDDQLKALETDSKRYGTQGENIDFALLVDGLEAEREQGITIDVAYRFFATGRRRFIVADTPAMSNIRATWPPGLLQPNWRFWSLIPAKASSPRHAATTALSP